MHGWRAPLIGLCPPGGWQAGRWPCLARQRSFWAWVTWRWRSTGSRRVLGFLTWLSYVAIYTPLKSRTPANTAVGAIAGALPVFIGWASVGAPLGLRACALFLIVYLWQFPHFMAIAWLYRHDYAQAGLQMLPVVDPSGRRAGAQAVVSALALVPVSLLCVLDQPLSLVLGGGLLLLGVGQFACAVAFLLRREETAARRLLRASLVYLPAVLAVLTLGPLMAWR